MEHATGPRMPVSRKKKILVVGATGGVGRFVSDHVIRLFGSASLVVGDYKLERGEAFAHELGAEVSFQRVDGTQTASIEGAVEGVEAVIVAVQLQSSQGSAGTTGIGDMLGVFAQPVRFRSHGEQHVRPGFTVKREMMFPPPFGNRTQRLINYVEVPVVAEKCDVHDVNYWSGFDEASFEILLAFLNKVGFLRLFNLTKTRKGLARMIALTKRGKRPESETIAVTVEVAGHTDGSPRTRCLSLVGPSDYGTTAMSVVAMAKLLLESRVEAVGMRVPMEVFPLDSLVEAMDCDEVTLHWLK